VSDARYVRIAALKNGDLFKRHLQASGIDLDFDPTLAPAAESPFAQPSSMATFAWAIVSVSFRWKDGMERQAASQAS
jgi:hypothetical protein